LREAETQTEPVNCESYFEVKIYLVSVNNWKSRICRR